MKSIYMWIILQEQPKVAWAWEKFGGSFTKGLSQALLHADPINAKKIHDTWTKYWQEGLDQYEQLTEANEVIENMKLCMDDKYDYDCVAEDVDVYLKKWSVK